MAVPHTPASLQRVGFLVKVPQLLTELNMDSRKVILASGLDPNALDDPQGTIPYRKAGLLLELAAERTACPHFGLKLGKLISTHSLGLLGEWMRNMPTLRKALRGFAENQHRNAHGAVMYLTEDGDQALFGYAVYEPGIRGSEVIYDAAAAAMSQVVCELVQESASPIIETKLSRHHPVDTTPYSEIFGVRLRFEAEQTAIVLPRALLDRPVLGADASVLKVLDKRVEELWNAGELDTPTRLRRELRMAILNGRSSAEEIAEQMYLSRRTFHRRLNECGLQFRSAIDESRFEFTKQLLSNTSLGVGEISFIAGYSSPGVLTRSFARWAGMTPKDRRSNHRPC